MFLEIGLFFGSFNPIHSGHLIIAQHALNYTQKIWFVVSPQNPLKTNNSLLDIDSRLLLTKEAIKDNIQFEICNVELTLPTPSYTIKTLNHLSIMHPLCKFSLIIGSDNFLSIDKWQSSDIILSKYQMLVYERPDFSVNKEDLPSNIIIMKAPLINISSTEIRSLIKREKSIRYLVPEGVASLIKENNFFI